jgi:hypothetical protein
VAQSATQTQTQQSAHTGDRRGDAGNTDLQTLLPKLVESFRIGQNRAGNTEVRMELTATTTGGMGIRMSHGPGGIQAILLVDQYAAKTALEGQIAELTQRLEAHGVRVQEVRVEIDSDAAGQRSPSGHGQGAFGDGRDDGSDADPYASPFDEPRTVAPAGSGSAGRVASGRRDSAGSSDGAGLRDATGSPSRRSRTDYSL